MARPFSRAARRLGTAGFALAACAVAALAGGAGAASIRTCPDGNCLTLTVLPGTVSHGETGVAVADFTNLGPATANHVEVQFFSSGPTLGTVSTTAPDARCAQQECDLGQIRGFGEAKVFAVFTGSASGTITAKLTFDESNGSKPTVDTVVKSGTVAVSSSAGVTGDCLSSGDTLVANSGDGQQRVAVPFTPPVGGLPCDPVGAFVANTPPPIGYAERIVGVDLLFDLTGAGLGNVVLDYATLPGGATYQTFVLQEVVSPTGTTPIQTVVVGPCGPDGKPQTGDPSQSTDSCVALREPLGAQGAELTLHVYSQPSDPRYVG